MTEPSSLRSILEHSRIVVLLGAGGVGKTTSSTVLAVAAARMGRRVALLSIDPAKRLADALGIKLGSEMRPVALPDCKGELVAAMLDQKVIFDQMVERHAPSPSIARQIKDHPVYVAASTNLSGPLEYMALAKLKDLAEDSRYDLVILDTPPDSHALDFLGRPNVLGGFMGNKMMTLLIKPIPIANRLGLGKLMSAGEKLMGGIAKVTGVSALRSFAEFLILVQEVVQGFHQSGEAIVRLLRREDTSFCMVAVPTSASSRSSLSVAEELFKLGYSCDLVLLNRCLPADVRVALENMTDISSGSEMEVLHRRLLAENHVRRRLADLAKGSAAFLTIPEQPFEIHSLSSLITMADSVT